jgi:hypothetical protein
MGRVGNAAGAGAGKAVDSAASGSDLKHAGMQGGKAAIDDYKKDPAAAAGALTGGAGSAPGARPAAGGYGAAPAAGAGSGGGAAADDGDDGDGDDK